MWSKISWVDPAYIHPPIPPTPPLAPSVHVGHHGARWCACPFSPVRAPHRSIARTSTSLAPFDVEQKLTASLADSPTDGHVRPELADRQGACQEGAPCQDDPTAHPDAPCPLWCARSPPQQDGGPHVNAADSAAKGGPGSDKQTSMAGATGFCPAGFEFGGKKGAANEPTGVGAELRQPQPPPQVAATAAAAGCTAGVRSSAVAWAVVDQMVRQVAQPVVVQTH